MLKRISPTLSSASSEAGSPAKAAPAPVLLRDASFPAPFAHGLEYSPPCRGTWNIVHTGMQIPETHQIFICASGCLRGVVLTAAEMGLMGRFSSIELHENDLTGRDNEMLIIEGVADILARLPQKPRAVLLYPACVHHFLGCNLRYVYKELRRRFPDIAFAECFMDPIRQTRHLTPEERLRRALGRLLPEHLPKERQVSIFGSNRKTSPASDFIQLLQKNGWQVRDMANCASYDEFLQLGSSRLNLCINPFSLPAVHDMKKRLQQDFLYLPQVWSMQEITALLAELAQKIGAGPQDFTALQARADEALKKHRLSSAARPSALTLRSHSVHSASPACCFAMVLPSRGFTRTPSAAKKNRTSAGCRNITVQQSSGRPKPLPCACCRGLLSPQRQKSSRLARKPRISAIRRISSTRLRAAASGALLPS